MSRAYTPRQATHAAGKTSNRRWRSLLEHPECLAAAYPSLADMVGHPAGRQRVLQVMAASLALGGLAGCDPGTPDGHLIPAVQAPPEIVPGNPNNYSSVHVVSGDALGIVVTHQMGRPIKVEGNPNHPASLGSTDPFAQAMLLDFYDPDRASALLQNKQPSDWPSLLTTLTDMRVRLGTNHVAGLRILTGDVISPTTGRLIDGLLAAYPDARWHQWEPTGRDSVHAGIGAAHGQVTEVLPYPDRADVILAPVRI